MFVDTLGGQLESQAVVSFPMGMWGNRTQDLWKITKCSWLQSCPSSHRDICFLKPILNSFLLLSAELGVKPRVSHIPGICCPREINPSASAFIHASFILYINNRWLRRVFLNLCKFNSKSLNTYFCVFVGDLICCVMLFLDS